MSSFSNIDISFLFCTKILLRLLYTFTLTKTSEANKSYDLKFCAGVFPVMNN